MKRLVFPRELHRLEKDLVKNKIKRNRIIHNFYDIYGYKAELKLIARLLGSTKNKKILNKQELYEFLNSNAFKSRNIDTIYSKLKANNIKDEVVWYIFAISTLDLPRYSFTKILNKKRENEIISMINVSLRYIKDPHRLDCVYESLVKFYTDIDFFSETKATYYLSLIKDLEIQRSSKNLIKLEKLRRKMDLADGWKNIKLIHEESHSNSLFVKSLMNLNRPRITKQLLDKEMKCINQNGGLDLAVNINLENLIKILKGNYYKSIWNIEEPIKTKEYMVLRDKTERILGIRKKNSKNSVHPFFGGVISISNKLNRIWGPAPNFGEFYMILDKSKLVNLSTFTFGDSFGDLSKAHPLTWNEVLEIKALVNLGFFKDEEGHGKIFEYLSYLYVEAQILYPLHLDLIESINLPFKFTHLLPNINPFLNGHIRKRLFVIFEFKEFKENINNLDYLIKNKINSKVFYYSYQNEDIANLKKNYQISANKQLFSFNEIYIS